MDAARKQGADFPDNSENCPRLVAYLWSWFCELSHTRVSNGFGGGAISFAEIHAWAQLNRIDVTPWEVGVLRSLDQVLTEHRLERRKADEKDAKRRGAKRGRSS